MEQLTPHYVEDPLSFFMNSKRVSIQTTRRNKPPITIEQWTSAFQVFSTIYIQKRPKESSDLLKYSYMIREMYDLYGDQPWRMYDEI